jgi:plastocyanin
MKITKSLLLSLVLLTGVSFGALAGEIVITQENKKFNKKKLKAAVGDVINFKNIDAFTHNLYSKKGEKFDSGVLKPGGSFSYKISKNGKFTVRCAIHPKMKLKVKVK